MRSSFLVLVFTLVLFSGANNDFEEFDQNDPPAPNPSPSNFEEHQEDPTYDEDEFITQKPQPKVEPSVKATPEAQVKQPNDWPSFFLKWWLETLYISFLVIYGINYSLGSSRNEAIVTAWGTKYQRLFLDNFFQVGVDGTLIVKGSQNTFTLNAAGRINCLGLTATLELKKRHDLVYTLMGLISPSQDKIIIDVPMENEMTPIVFALIAAKDEKLIKKEANFKDINQFAKKRTDPHFQNSDLSIYSESNELMTNLLSDHHFRNTLASARGLISLIHFTDQCLWNPKYKKCLRFVYILPSNLDRLDALMELTISTIDLVANVKLSPQILSKSVRMREEAAAVKQSGDNKAEMERRAAAAEERYREALQKMTPAEREKEEKKRAKKALKKKQQSKIKVIK